MNFSEKLRGDNLKTGIKIMMFLLLITFSYATKTFAENPLVKTSGISLDGNFDDWVGKPELSDPNKDTKGPWMDFLNVKYIADNEYLYIYVERLAAKKSEPWHFDVVIFNAVSGQPQLQYPFGQSESIYAPQFDITTSFPSSKNEALVNVSFDGQNIENTFTSSNNNKEIEFRIPLSKVGLDGFNKQIKFAFKSDTTSGAVIDWVPDKYEITMTTGPTGSKISSILFFIVVSLIAYRTYKYKNQST